MSEYRSNSICRCVALRKESVDRNLPVLVLPLVPWVALRKESVDRNRKRMQCRQPQPRSLSARRAWIEITAWLRSTCWYSVALRKESVDRNMMSIILTIMQPVALRKESVDRNAGRNHPWRGCRTSLSARRAWIEIMTGCSNTATRNVALRKESVDRNHQPTGISEMGVPSLSARRAWIEILLRRFC